MWVTADFFLFGSGGTWLVDVKGLSLNALVKKQTREGEFMILFLQEYNISLHTFVGGGGRIQHTKKNLIC